jgi:hypothetical protein
MSDGGSGGGVPPPSSGSDGDADSLTSFLFYTLFVYPVCSWILSPNRFSRRLSILYAVSFLALLASLKTGLELSERPPNYFVQLGVLRSSPPADVKRGYKLMSLKLHPDKNPSPTANDEFAAIKEAYDVLLDSDGRRAVYCKFGLEGLRSNKSTADELQILLEMGVYYATWGMIVFVMTLGKGGGDARTWIYTALLAMLLVEVTLLTSPNPLPDWFFPTTTEHEWIWLLHQLFPAVMNGCRIIGTYTYVDVERQTRLVLTQVLKQQEEVLATLRDLKSSLQHSRVVGGGGGGLEGVGAGGGGALLLSSSVNGEGDGVSTPAKALGAVEARMQADGASVAAAVSQLHNDGNKTSGMGFYVLIIAYIAISYAFNR